MRRVITTLALALCLLLGCSTTRDEQVPLITSENDSGGACWLMHETADVIADPTSGTPTLKAGTPLKWPTGYTARRAGTAVEVVDSAGNVVLTTGRRYELAPTPASDFSEPLSEWVIGCVTPCPECALGWGVD